MPNPKPSDIVVPARRPGEDGLSYIERLEWHRQRAPQIEVVGAAASARGFIPHQKTQRIGKTEDIRETVVPFNASIFGDDPAPPKRTPEERLRLAMAPLIAIAEDTYKRFGRVVLPHSVTNEVVEAFRLMGQVVTPEKIETMAVNQLEAVFATVSQRWLDKATQGG